MILGTSQSCIHMETPALVCGMTILGLCKEYEGRANMTVYL